MTGVSDLPFRQAAARLGAAYLATEMVACESFVASRPEAVRRSAVGAGLPLMVVQLVGAERQAIAKAATLAARAGAQIIDINFGCPAKSVTGVACGSALMRQPALAQDLVAATVDAAGVPVTVKMRLGWDDSDRNAPELAARAQAAGAAGITVHGRTRQQFYTGAADWRAVRAVKSAVDLPVIVNGDVVDVASARAALAQSGADGVMIGRGATGRPWIAATIEAALTGVSQPEPEPEQRLGIVLDHLDASLAFYGDRVGLKVVRKHLAAYVEQAPWPAGAEARRRARAELCRLETAGEVEAGLIALWEPATQRFAA